MNNTLLIGLSNQMALRRSMDIIANNIANVSTNAFRRETVLFEEYLKTPENAPPRTEPLAMVLDSGVFRDDTEGAVQATGAPLDVAIRGRGYLAVETAEGVRYTRNGHLALDETGRIVTGSGEPVLGEGGPITIQGAAGSVTIAGDGTVSAGEQVVGRLKVVTFENEAALTKAGGTLYDAGDQREIPSQASLAQGFLEGSNVKPIVEMTLMIEVMRAYEATSNALQGVEEASRRAVQKLGEQR